MSTHLKAPCLQAAKLIRLEVATEMVQVMLEEEGNCMQGEEAEGMMPFGLHTWSSFSREGDARVDAATDLLTDVDADSASVLDSPAAGTDDRRGILLLYTYLVVLFTVRSFLLSPSLPGVNLLQILFRISKFTNDSIYGLLCQHRWRWPLAAEVATALQSTGSSRASTTRLVDARV